MSWSRQGGRSGPRGYHHGDLKETLIRAALELIAQKGPAGFTFAEAARWAGVSPAAPLAAPTSGLPSLLTASCSLRSCANADPSFKDITKFMNPQPALDFPAATTATWRSTWLLSGAH
jgi:Bacterial regulatory proteins, tetR family